MSEGRVPYGATQKPAQPAGVGLDGGGEPYISDSEAALAAALMFNSLMGRFQDLDLEVTNRRIAHGLRVLRRWLQQPDDGVAPQG